MPKQFETMFFTIGQGTYRLHFPYMLEGFEKRMIAEDESGKFTSDTREYFIKGFTFGNATFDIFVKEIGADILPGRIDAWFTQGGKEASIPLDLLADIMMKSEEATQNRVIVNVIGKRA